MAESTPLSPQHIKAARSPAESTASKRVRAEMNGPTQRPKVAETAAQIAATSNISPTVAGTSISCRRPIC